MVIDISDEGDFVGTSLGWLGIKVGICEMDEVISSSAFFNRPWDFGVSKSNNEDDEKGGFHFNYFFIFK
jgi:hypothetical protein